MSVARDERRTAWAADQATRRLVALFRARARRLYRSLDTPSRLAMQLLPALFHANFPWGQLKGEPPGVRGLGASVRWTRLARDFDLPPPTGRQRGKKLVAALLVTPRPGALDVHVVPVAGLSQWEEQRIAQRARAVDALFKRRTCPITITPVGPSAQPYDSASRTRLVSFGALLAGELPEGFFEAGAPTAEPLASNPFRTAPSELAATLSLLAVEPWAGGEGAELAEAVSLARAAGVAVWRLADPGLFVAARAALRLRTPWLPFAAVALASTEKAPAADGHRLCAALGGGARLPEPGAVPSLEQVLGVAGQLALELSLCVRRCPKSPDSDELRTVLAWEVLTHGCPRVLLPTLYQAIRRIGRGNAVPPLIEVWNGRKVEVKLGAGAVLGRGASAPHAWARAIGLLSAAAGRVVLPPGSPAPWRTLAARLLRRPARRTLWLDAEPQDIPGAPHDPLNRGPQRALAVQSVLLLVCKPSSRPSARELPSSQLVPLVLQETVDGYAVGFSQSNPLAQQLEARVTRLVRRCKAVVPRRPLAVETEGRVIVVEGQGLSTYGRSVFARRPVQCVLDPEAPEFAEPVTHGRDQRVSPNQLETLVWADDEHTAQLVTLDSEGWAMREHVPLEHIEPWLADAQVLLRRAPISVLSVQGSGRVVRLVTRRTRRAAPDIDVTLKGELPWLVLELDGEAYGARQKFGWSAAASTILSRWPMHVRGAIRFREVDISVGGVAAGGLLRLYARSWAYRKLNVHIGTLAHT